MSAGDDESIKRARTLAERIYDVAGEGVSETPEGISEALSALGIAYTSACEAQGMEIPTMLLPLLELYRYDNPWRIKNGLPAPRELHVCIVGMVPSTCTVLEKFAASLDLIAREFGARQPNRSAICLQAAEVFRHMARRKRMDVDFGGVVALKPEGLEVPS